MNFAIASPGPRRLLQALLLWIPAAASASVNVTVNGNVATAQIALPDASPTYFGTVTIVFDAVVNLTPDSVNVSAELVDPNSFSGLPANVAIDANFPVLVSVEPPSFLFTNGFEAGQVGNGNLDFLNSYEFEFHSDEQITCDSPSSDYRLYKAPHGRDTFADISDGIYHGSVRARGRGGAFSRFLIVHDARAQSVLGVPVLALDKWTTLATRLVAATLGSGLNTTLTNLLGLVFNDIVTLNIVSAINDLDAFSANVVANAGSNIANEWNAVDLGLDPSPNDAGELLSLAQTLRFTLALLNGSAPVCQAPPPA